MYHDRYSRRRTADSFHDDEGDGVETETAEAWSWTLFVGVILIQVTSRSVWASFGVISIFIFGDQGPSWVLLATPVAFSVTWGLTEPWVKILCKTLTTATEFMYIIVAGTVIAWFGTIIIAVKSLIDFPCLIPLLGVIGGCGANIMATASTALVRKHFPTRTGAVRFFEQITASLAFFLMPILSCFTMQTYGEHGGLLIHGGILMQGFIGCSLISCVRRRKFNKHVGKRPRSYAFIQDENDDAFLPSPSSEQEKHYNQSINVEEGTFQISPATNKKKGVKSGKNAGKVSSGKRIAFGLGAMPDTPPEKRKRRSTYQGLLPSIMEIEEGEGDYTSEESVDRTEIPSAPASPVNSLPKPPRTFEHSFSSDRLIMKLDGRSANDTGLNFYWSNISEMENMHKHEPARIDSTGGRSHPSSNHKTEQDWSWSQIKQRGTTMLAEFPGFCRESRTKILWDCNAVWEKLLDPLTIPAAFLLYTTQSCLLGFLTLTPALLDAFIDDGTKMDGAYCVCVMGFTWLCFVMASPCFSTIHFSNHQTICIVALLSSSLTLYMVSQSSTLDEMVLYSSLFGLSYGVARMTSYSILKMSFGSTALNDLGVLLSVVASVFQLLFLMLVVVWEWTHHLKNLYKFQVVALVCSAVFWTIQGCVSSVRAKRGQHEFTWSRRRRVS